jgi:hypothetical protein
MNILKSIFESILFVIFIIFFIGFLIFTAYLIISYPMQTIAFCLLFSLLVRSK